MGLACKRFGVRVRKSEPNPYDRVEYLYDAEGMKPARMDFESGVFDYGDWADVWFVKDNCPCMLGFDGVEQYRLDPDDYSKREDGRPSDVANAEFGGNAMAAIPLVWLKAWEDDEYQYFSVSPERYDESYHAHAHAREDGSIAQRMYLPLFEGSLVDGKLRSLMGLAPTVDTTAAEEMDAATDTGRHWTLLPWSAANLIAILCLIMSKCDDCQQAFGRGNSEQGATAGDLIMTGSAYAKGAFFGSLDGASAVKVFHVENFWGNRIDRMVGIVNDFGNVKVKMSAPYSIEDFSEYADTGIIPANPDGSMGAMRFLSESVAGEFGRIPRAADGAGDAYQCDGFVFKNDMLAIATHGGRAGKGDVCGCWFMNLADSPAHATWHLGPSPAYVG